jgi:hypothetical protein
VHLQEPDDGVYFSSSYNDLSILFTLPFSICEIPFAKLTESERSAATFIVVHMYKHADCGMYFSFSAADAIRADRIAELLQRRQEYDIRQLNVALDEFRALHQQPSSRREWDLNDPDSLKKDCPARVSDDDPRCGISSMQRFDGEDLNNKARSKYQTEQRRQWAEQQMREKHLVSVINLCGLD